VSEVLTTVALTRPDVRLTATHDGRSAFDAPAAASLRARVGAVHGAAYADGLLDVDDVSGPAHVSGLAERPGAVGSAPRRVFVAVNGRAVRDAGVVRAAEARTAARSPPGCGRRCSCRSSSGRAGRRERPPREGGGALPRPLDRRARGRARR
jgi:DNA mismatch repair protein MutL